MSTQTDNNKRIAKNTIALYIRMLLVMGVSLYTSRLILNTLGVTDFGIYNLVAGVVILFSFLNSSMTNATQRFLNVAIGKKDNVQRVFSASLTMHIILIGIVLILAETIGLWFIKYKLNIPSERFDATIITYQLAIITTCINILKVPFNASVIANERMSFFAYSGLVEVFLKLIVVWMLLAFDYDKLITYSILLLFVNIILLVWYILYCLNNFTNNKIIFSTNKYLIKELTSFSGWNLFGSIADVGYKQGTSFILNVFCGVTLNATMGIINQIRSAIFSFTANLQVAANPQIIKSYSAGEYEYFKNLVCKISKYSFFLMFIICYPIILNIDYILHIWLKNPPEHSNSFTILILIFCMLDSLNGPLWTSMQATGKIKFYQIVTSCCLLLNLPLSYYALYLKICPESILIIQIFVAILTLVVRIYFSKKYTQITYLSYTTQVIIPIFLILIVAIPIPYWLSLNFTGLFKLIITGLTCLPLSLLSIYFIGINKTEKEIFNQYILQKINKR